MVVCREHISYNQAGGIPGKHRRMCPACILAHPESESNRALAVLPAAG